MPLYDFHCPACDAHFEAQLPFGEIPPCPACGHAETQKVIGGFALGSLIRPTGSEARRLDANRASHEVQRQEAKAERAEARKQGPS